jgi:uncharacterized membrane protein
VNDDDARRQARERLESKRGFWNFLMVFVIVSAALIGIWALSGAGFFWPVFPIGGMAIGVALSAWGIFGEKPITEADVDREVERRRGA